MCKCRKTGGSCASFLCKCIDCCNRDIMTNTVNACSTATASQDLGDSSDTDNYSYQALRESKDFWNSTDTSNYCVLAPTASQVLGDSSDTDSYSYPVPLTSHDLWNLSDTDSFSYQAPFASQDPETDSEVDDCMSFFENSENSEIDD